MLLGAERILDELTEDNLESKIDVTAWMEANNMDKLEDEKIYKIAPTFVVADGVEVLETDSVEIIVNKLED